MKVHARFIVDNCSKNMVAKKNKNFESTISNKKGK